MVCGGRDVVTMGSVSPCYCDKAVAVAASAKRARLAGCSVPEYQTSSFLQRHHTLHITFIYAETINKHRATHLITVSAFASRLKLCW